MKPSSQPSLRQSLLATSATSLILIVGCASPAPPRPPSLKLPRLVKDLTAERVGNEARLHWTTPDKTTDDLDIKGSISAEICRAAAVTSTPPPTSPITSPDCIAVKTIPIQPGPSHAEEILPTTLTSDPVALLSYRVRILNSNGHTAGLSNEAHAAAGAAPLPVEQLRITPIPAGAMVEWQSRDTSATVELDRLIDGATITPHKSTQKSGSPLAAKSKSRSQEKSQPKKQPEKKPADEPAPAKSLLATPPPAVELKLQTPKQNTDPGGTIDRTAQRGETYDYTAQRVRSVTVAGHTLEIRSAAAAPVIVHMRDTFPPQIPTGLAAVSGEHAIDLSWEPGNDPDLAGYNIYRQEVLATGTLAGTASRLNATPVVGPAYSDMTATPGRRYVYRVTAVDSTGNESAPCVGVQETLTEP